MSQNLNLKVCECGGQRVKILPNRSQVCQECLRSVATWRPISQWLAQKECFCGNNDVYWRAIRREWVCTVCHERFGNFKHRAKGGEKLDPALVIKIRKSAGKKMWLSIQKKAVWGYIIIFTAMALLVTLYRPEPGANWQRTPEITFQNLFYGMPWSIALTFYFSGVLFFNLKVVSDIHRNIAQIRPRDILSSLKTTH